MNNECHCPDPPGGYVRCAADQLAICRVVDGKVESLCLSLPDLPAAVAAALKSDEGHGVAQLLTWLAARTHFEVTKIDGRPIARKTADPAALSRQKERVLNSIRRGESISLEGVATHEWIAFIPGIGGSIAGPGWDKTPPGAEVRTVRVAVKMPAVLAEHLQENAELEAGV